MSVKQAAFLTSRVICLFFIYQGFRALLEVPATFAMISAFSSLRNSPGLGEYGIKMLASGVTLAVEGGTQIILAIIFYKCGPWIIRFLTGEEQVSATSEQP
ncbi:MAG TPA: hypothetical protein VIJ38_07190 [Acidobacteriaceae bacterium]